MTKAEKTAEEKRLGVEIAEDILWRWKGAPTDQIKAAACIVSHFELSDDREAAMLDKLGLKWARTQMGGRIIVAKDWPNRIICISNDDGTEEFYAFENGERGARLKVD